MIAITRKVSRAIGDCELTYLERQPIDVAVARRQHEAYEAALSKLGCRVISLPEEPGLPDSVFVEDAAIVLDEVAIITRPGADSRRPETESISSALAPYRQLLFVQAPATVDGGDVLRLGKTIYIGIAAGPNPAGRNGRSNQAALDQIRALLAPFGYSVRAVEVSGCLHLKSAVTQVAGDSILVNPAWVDPLEFTGMKSIAVDPSEPDAANGLLIGDALIYPAAFPRTIDRLASAGIRPILIEASELAKAEGAVTCCSLVFNT